MRRSIAISLGLAVILQTWFALAAPSGVAQFVSRVEWSEDAWWFGGFSGFEISDDGKTFWTVTDRGYLAVGTLTRADGQQLQAKLRHASPLLAPEGRPRPARNLDAEGVVVTPEGKIIVSFEREHRLWEYARQTFSSRDIAIHPLFKAFPVNGGLEAIALDAQGALFAVPESFEQRGNGIPVFRRSNDDWRIAFHIPKKGGFRPVGADFDDQGRFYLLERSFNLIGFRSRVRRFTKTDTDEWTEELLLQTRTGVHDNLEGISVWSDSAGALRMTMISDDNFYAFQRTEIVEYRLAADRP